MTVSGEIRAMSVFYLTSETDPLSEQLVGVPPSTLPCSCPNRCLNRCLNRMMLRFDLCTCRCLDCCLNTCSSRCSTNSFVSNNYEPREPLLPAGRQQLLAVARSLTCTYKTHVFDASSCIVGRCAQNTDQQVVCDAYSVTVCFIT